MLGALQILGCCTPSTTPVDPPAFPGEGKMVFTGAANVLFNLDVSKFYAFATASTPCDSYSILLYDGTYGEAVNSTISISDTSSALTSVDQGSYTEGIKWKYYSGNFTVTDKYISNDANSGTLLGSKSTVVSSGDVYATIQCDNPITFTTAPTRLYINHDQGWLNGISFYWLGVAQRELPGIRLKVISGSFTWFVKVAGGVVTVYTSDGTKTFSTSGTLNAVANAINASSAVNTWIQARCSGWGVIQYAGATGETNGNVAVGKNEWHYVYTKNDPSTLLKDLGPTYINVFCSDSYAPSGWATSTRLPIYERGDTLPPRGIVQMRSIDTRDIGFNTLYSTYPALKLYDNTSAGALSFLTEPIYVTSDRAWGADVSWNGFTSSLDVSAGTRFENIWHYSTLAAWTRYNNGPVNFNKNITYFYSPITLQVYNETFFGTCNYCQDFSLSSPCYQPSCPFIPPFGPVCSPTCTGGCDFNACGVYCFPSSCYYIGDPDAFTPSCASNAGCVINYSYYTPGATVATSPPSSGQYTAQVATNARFI